MQASLFQIVMALFNCLSINTSSWSVTFLEYLEFMCIKSVIWPSYPDKTTELKIPLLRLALILIFYETV